jgi:hypothetical protein
MKSAINHEAHPTTAAISAAAVAHGIYLIGGSIPERDESVKIFNTSVVFSPDGELIAKHRARSTCLILIFRGKSHSKSQILYLLVIHYHFLILHLGDADWVFAMISDSRNYQCYYDMQDVQCCFTLVHST